MGSVNTGFTNQCNCHRSLTDINTTFDQTTPMYMVVSYMKYDNAEYDIDVTELGTVETRGDWYVHTNAFWMTYPELGHTHVSITTRLDINGKTVRTVRCECESGRIYVNTFTRNNIYDGGYVGDYASIKPLERGSSGIFLDSIEYITKHALNPSITHTDLGISDTYFDEILTAVYGAESHYVDGYNISNGVNGILPHELISKGYILNFAWYLLSYGTYVTVDGAHTYSVPVQTTETLKTIYTHSLDIQSIPYVMLTVLYDKTKYKSYSSLKHYSGCSWFYDNFGGSNETTEYDIYDVVSLYIYTSLWSYSGWSCEDTAVRKLPDIVMPENNPANFDNYPCWSNSLYIDLSYRLYDIGLNINECVSENINNKDTLLHGSNINTNTIEFDSMGLSSSMEAFLYVAKELQADGVPFKPIERIRYSYTIDRIPFGGYGTIREMFKNLPDYVNLTGNLDFDNSSLLTITLELNSDSWDWTMYVHPHTSTSICVNTSDKDKSNMVSVWDSMPSKTIGVNPLNGTEGFRAIDSSAFDSAPLMDLAIYGNTVVTGEDSKSYTSPAEIKSVSAVIASTGPNILTRNILRIPTWNGSLGSIDPTTGAINDSDLEFINSGYIPIANYNWSGDNIYLKYHFDVIDLREEYVITIAGYDSNYNFTTLLLHQTVTSEGNLYSANPTQYTDGNTAIFTADVSYIRISCKNVKYSDMVIAPSIATLTKDNVQAGTRCVVNTPLRSIGNIRDKIYRKNDVWYHQRNILKGKIYLKDNFVYVNDHRCDVVLDENATDLTNDIYVFHIGEIKYSGSFSENSQSDPQLIGPINVASRELISPTAITSLTIPSGEEVLTGAPLLTTTDIPSGQVAIYLHRPFGDTDQPVMLTKYTENINHNDTYTSGQNCSFDPSPYRTTVMPHVSMYDICNQNLCKQHSQVITVACNFNDINEEITATINQLTFNGGLVALKRYLELRPIEFYYCPQFEFNETYNCNVTEYPLTVKKNSTYSNVTDYIPQDIPLDPVIQAKLNNMRTYADGTIFIDYGDVAGTATLYYALNPKRYFNDLEYKLAELETRLELLEESHM